MNEPDRRDAREGGSDDLGLDMLLRQLRDELGLNLRQYKPNYLRRRIGVRMRAIGCADYLQYRQYIRQDPAESRRLINDLTINVTEFFRDPDVYEAIRKETIPGIMAYKRENRIYSLRAWSAGCATGEEPYSLAILFSSALRLEGSSMPWAVRIAASDLDDQALAKAKAGRYDTVKLLPGMALEDYFVREGEGYAVREEIKRMVRFMLLDIMKQPPMRHLDLILCRNVLIYFEREKQQRILEIFQRCLRPGGFLVLGKSEAIIGAEGTGFIPVRRKERIYRKEEGREGAGHQAGGAWRRGERPPGALRRGGPGQAK